VPILISKSAPIKSVIPGPKVYPPLAPPEATMVPGSTVEGWFWTFERY